LAWTHAQIGFINVFGTAAGTTFLVGFFRHIGFSELHIAIYGSFMGVAGLFSIFGSWIAQKTGHYRRTVLALYVLAILFLLGGVYMGAFGGGIGAMPVLVICLVALYLFFLYMAPSVLLAWLHGIVGNGGWEKFFSTRMIIGDSAVLATSLAVGACLGAAPKTGSFLSVFTGAALVGMLSVYATGRMPKPSVAEKYPEIRVYLRIITESIRKREIRWLVIIAFLRAFAYGLIMPFQPLFLLEILKLDYSAISYLICLGTVFAIAFYKVWAYLQKRIGNASSLKWTLLLPVIEPFLWAVAKPGAPLTVYLAFALFGLAGVGGMINAGHWPCYVSVMMQFSDERQKPVNVSLYFLAYGIATIVSPQVGGLILSHFNAAPLYFGAGAVMIDGFMVIFIITGLLLIGAMAYAMTGTGRRGANQNA